MMPQDMVSHSSVWGPGIMAHSRSMAIGTTHFLAHERFISINISSTMLIDIIVSSLWKKLLLGVSLPKSNNVAYWLSQRFLSPTSLFLTIYLRTVFGKNESRLHVENLGCWVKTAIFQWKFDFVYCQKASHVNMAIIFFFQKIMQPKFRLFNHSCAKKYERPWIQSWIACGTNVPEANTVII